MLRQLRRRLLVTHSGAAWLYSGKECDCNTGKRVHLRKRILKGAFEKAMPPKYLTTDCRAIDLDLVDTKFERKPYCLSTPLETSGELSKLAGKDRWIVFST